MAGIASHLMRNPEMLRGMMESPMMQSMMSNPAMMETVIRANPALRDLVERRPEIRAALTNPDLMRQSMRAALDPAYAAELGRTTDRAIANIESHPSGMRALESMWSEVGEPLSEALTGGDRGSGDDGAGEGGSAPGASTPDPDAPVADPLPNPWGPSVPPAARASTAHPFGSIPRASTATGEDCSRGQRSSGGGGDAGAAGVGKGDELRWQAMQPVVSTGGAASSSSTPAPPMPAPSSSSSR